MILINFLTMPEAGFPVSNTHGHKYARAVQKSDFCREDTNPYGEIQRTSHYTAAVQSDFIFGLGLKTHKKQHEAGTF
jgi:hypothetical protein